MSGRFRLRKISQQLHRTKPDEPLTIPGELGLRLGGERLVEVPSRPGFVYVRLRNDQSEVVQAFNDRVTPIYGLPVTVVRDRVDRGRYYITGRDTGRYNNWGSSAYLPRHGAMHSWNPDAPGIDPVWVYSRQFMPMLGVPSGSSASMNVLVYPGTLYYDNRWIYAGMTGTPDLTSYRPTGANARMILVYMDQNGNPSIRPGSYFDPTLTGTQQIYPYLPAMPGDGMVPIAGVRLLSGSSTVTWDNLYDLRQFLHWGVFTGTAGTGGGSSGHTIQSNGTPLTARNYLNFVGTGFSVFDDPINGATVVSGTASGGGSSVAVAANQIAFATADASGLTGSAMFKVQTPQADGRTNVYLNSAGLDEWAYMQDYALNVVSLDNLADRGVAIWNYNSGSNVAVFQDFPPLLSFYGSRGTQSGPVQVTSGTVLGQINFHGRSPNDIYLGGMIRTHAIATAADGYVNTVMRFVAGGSGTAASQRYLFNQGLELYLDRMIGYVPLVVSTGTNQGFYWGDIRTNGSWRSVIANERVEFQKRVGGVWVTQGYSNSGSASGGSAHVVQDDGTPLTQRANLNFVGSGFVVYDDAGNDATVVSGTATGGGSFTGTVTGYAANDLTWQVDGALYTGTNVVTPFIIPRPGRITNVLAYAANLGVTGSTVVDITKNGVSIFGVSKPTLAYNGASYVEVAPTTIDLAKGDVLALNILGFAPSARDLTVTVVNETTGSATNLSGTFPHTMLSDLNTATYWHLTQTERNALVTGATTDLHSHAIVDQFLMDVYPFIKVFDDTNGFTVQTSGTASFTTGWPIAVAATGATSGSRVTINATAGIFVYNNVQQYYTRYRIDLHTVTTVESSCTIWAGLFTNPGSPAATESHMAFKIVNGDIYASCGNGTNGNLVDTGLNFSQFNRRRLEIKQVGTDIEYYIDSNLVHTFTTYAPTAVQLNAAVQIGNSTAANKSINVYPLMIVQGQL